MIQILLQKLDQTIYFFGFAPDLKLRIAFSSIGLQLIIISFLSLYLLYTIIFKKNLNYLKKRVL